MGEDTLQISQALNMPPIYSAHEKGRALVMYNASVRDDIKGVIPHRDDWHVGTGFWDQPASTLGESKEMLDAYYETFHGTTHSETGYLFNFEKMLLPYLPYFSNCNTFDSYIPFWMLVEDENECALPPDKDENWPRYKFDPLPDADSVRVVGPFNVLEEPVADYCQRELTCNYEENLYGQDNTARWFEIAGGEVLFHFLRYPVDWYEYTGRTATSVGIEDGGGQKAYEYWKLLSDDNYIPVFMENSAAAGFSELCEISCFARAYTLTVKYYQRRDEFGKYSKQIILAELAGDEYDFDADRTDYVLSIDYLALGWFDLILNFAFTEGVFIALFVVMGAITVLLCYLIWLTTRIFTPLQNPPPMELYHTLVLMVPPSIIGVFLAIIPSWILTQIGNMVINGHFFDDPGAPTIDEWGSETTAWMDRFNLNYADMPAEGVPDDIGSPEITIGPEEQGKARSGRIGTVFAVVAFCSFNVANGMFFPRAQTARDTALARRRVHLAEKEFLWTPNLWLKGNFMFTSMFFGIFCVQLVQLSYWGDFGTYVYIIIVMMEVFGFFFEMFLGWQLQDSLLVSPIMAAYIFFTGLVTFGSPDFVQFLLAYFVGFFIQVTARLYQDDYLDNVVFASIEMISKVTIKLILFLTPKYLHKNYWIKTYLVDEVVEADYSKREIEGVVSNDDSSESVEPILGIYNVFCQDIVVLWYMPYFVYLFMQYRNQIGIPAIYGIRQSDMLIYMMFQIVILFFQPICDSLMLMSVELYSGWKVFDYLVYSRYRYLQRERRWKGMEDSLDECIEEGLRKLDQMCFSSQYFMMLCVQMNGVIYVVFAVEIWIRTLYSPFTDTGFATLSMVLIVCYLLMEWVTLKVAVYLQVWKIKHENTAWHILQKEEDELDIPGWEDLKGASHEAYLMNQRISSETFRFKFLNYNRTWLINQLPQLLTPRTMRRSRPYLINQFARIINARRDDISDDSDGGPTDFGPVVLTAPSRNIIRWWLGKAKRRLRLKTIVEPLIRRARGAECEQCLSRKKLQIEYEIDVDAMADMYDKSYPGDEEVDQVQWKTFWMNNQRYHTTCLACLTKRKEVSTRAALAGVADLSMFDDEQEEYPDWGPVYLTAASKAILLNWYRKAQRSRVGKKGAKVRRTKIAKDVSDDEEEKEAAWIKNYVEPSQATIAIAIKWVRTARARMQKKRGKGASLKEKDLVEDEGPDLGTAFRSGRKSKMTRK